MTVQITKYCKRCKGKFMYGDMSRTLQGQMSRKYCDECNILQGEDHRRNEYARKKQLMEIKQ
tara:strand:- start:164 stop:349 length:186 start_codon:yes stop_codon:yes gene_type:complete